MLGGLDDVSGDEACELGGAVVDLLDLEPQHGELLADLRRRRRGVEMLLQPGEGELHRTCPPPFFPSPCAAWGRWPKAGWGADVVFVTEMGCLLQRPRGLPSAPSGHLPSFAGEEYA